jgi:hypothetical protein
MATEEFELSQIFHHFFKSISFYIKREIRFMEHPSFLEQLKIIIMRYTLYPPPSKEP